MAKNPHFTYPRHSGIRKFGKISGMELKVLFSEDPAFVLSRAGVFLSSQPVFHNLILSIVHARVAQGEPGRYWMTCTAAVSVDRVAP
jgi:hypothetical protein